MTLEHPQWNREDKALFRELYYCTSRELTEKEKAFCKEMASFEKIACGLQSDGLL